MNLSQIQADSYSFLKSSVPAKAFNEQKSVVQYIETLATQTNTRVDQWDIGAIFGAEDRALGFVTDKNTINRRFFEHKEKAPQINNTEQIDQIKELLSSQIKSNSQAQREIELKAVRQRYITTMRSATSIESQLLELVKKGSQEYSIISSLEQRDVNYEVNQVAKMMTDKFWEFHSFDGVSLTFTTRNDVILKDVNPAAGVNLRVNMGKLKAVVPIKQIYETRVHRFLNNLDYNGYYHPHIKGIQAGTVAGVICWGNAQESARIASTQWELVSFMQLLGSLISSYSKENPYVDLVQFQRLKPDDAEAPIPVQGVRHVEEEQDDEEDETDESDEDDLDTF